MHRLDKDTTGLMVVAKTDRAHQALAAQFADHGRTGPLRRGYLALAWGAPAGRRAPSTRRSTAIRTQPRQDGGARRRPGGHHPLAGARALRRARDGKPVASLLDCRLETGRTHQIRVHLAHIGHPLLGDAAYGAGLQDQGRAACRPRPGTRWRPLADRPCMLISWSSSIPTSGKSLEFRSELPADLARLHHGLAAGRPAPRHP